MSKEKGSCLCGSVEFSVESLKPEMHACHCGMCRKLVGGPLLALDCGNEVSFKGEESITIFNSSDWAERGFCKKCGSGLFYRLKETQQYFMPAGIFENMPSFEFKKQIFIDDKPENYCFANETINLTGEEVFS